MQKWRSGRWHSAGILRSVVSFDSGRSHTSCDVLLARRITAQCAHRSVQTNMLVAGGPGILLHHAQLTIQHT